jgi:FAD:protein FMN transferase
MNARGAMNELSFQATGTEWWICCQDSALLPRAEALVRALEARLSRFLPDSSLSRLNQERACEDPLLAEVVQAALRLRALTGGAFDPTLGSELAGLGYYASFDTLACNEPSVAAREAPVSRRALDARVDGDRVTLHGDGALDLGGIAKGWMVDRVADMMGDAGCTRGVVDGGGDLRVLGGPWPIEVGDGHVVVLDSEAIATSSVRKRRWRDARGQSQHHILDPKTGAPTQGSIEVATVRASEAAVADAFATATLVEPELVLAVMPWVGARAAVEDAHGSWWTTPDWQELS